MAVRIRMKKLGRTHRPFYRICAMDSRSPRDGRALEELGHYDPMVPETDARVVLDRERVDYWLSVGATPTEKVQVLIKKYGTGGTHLKQQEEALARLQQRGYGQPAASQKAKPAARPQETAQPQEAVAEGSEG